MGNPDLVITIKGWIGSFSVLIKGVDYENKIQALNAAMKRFADYVDEIEKTADHPEELPPLNYTDIEIRELNPPLKNK